MKMTDTVKNTIAKYEMLSTGDHVLIGLSGGPDSVCLAIILNQLKSEFELSLDAIYVNHGLRPDEVGAEMDFCRKFCEEQGIAFHTRTIEAGKVARENALNLHEAARELRYTAFNEIASDINADRIALGHNADDQAETVLMRLLRGSGKRGLSGIPPVRGNIIRPLFRIEKADINEYLMSGLSQSFMVDSSNLKDEYFRNWIRNTFIEEIKKKNPAVIRDINRSADILREEDEYLEIVVTKTLMRLISRKSDSTIELFIRPLEIIEKPILRRVLRRAVSETKGLRGISYFNIEDIIKLINKGKSGDGLNLPGGIRVIKDYSILKITTEQPVVISGYELDSQGEVIIKEVNVMIRSSIEKQGAEPGDGRFNILLDAEDIKFPLTVGSRMAGDFFYPHGFGKKKKLQDFFVDEKISRDKRGGVPIVKSGNDIIWVAGLRADDRYKVTEKTETVLRLKMTRVGPL